MGLGSLPTPARLYWGFVCLLGVAAAGALPAFNTDFGKLSLVELGAFFVLAAVAGGKKVSLARHKGHADAVSMSLGFAITFAAMLRFGPVGALGAGTLSCLSGCLFPKRQPAYQMAFNVALSAVEALFGSVVYMAINGWSLELDPLRTFVAVCCSTLAFFVGNTGGVAVMIAICSKQNPVRLWRETFLWTAPSYLAGASVSALAIVLLGERAELMLLFVAPVVFVIYQTYAATTSKAEEKIRHAEEMQAHQARLADLYLATIKSLALAIDAKDQYTHQHILRVQKYAVALAVHMGLTGDELEAVNTGALLHDIGKLGVPEYVLLKPGKLTDDEFEKIKKHPEIGASILDPVEFPWPVLPVVKYHHEKWNGTGYPEGLKGEEIPLTARIMAVADVYDALTSSRSYRGAWSHERALATIVEGSGSHFDPVCVEAFVEAILPVVEEMAQEGCGPLTSTVAVPEAYTEATEQATKDIARASAEFWAIYEVAQTLGSCKGMTEAAEVLCEKLAGTFEGSACLFLLYDDWGERLNVFRASGRCRDQFVEASVALGTGPSVSVAVTGQTYLGNFADDDFEPGMEAVDMRSALIVQVAHEGTVLGTLNLYHGQDGYFGVQDQHLVETIADQAAAAMFSEMSLGQRSAVRNRAS